ncbi:hypothetical protein Clacol_001267 [Clathrus columnatus]|uniref:GH18 domain-containing protein n=1 Tax=Clathrus columnatus TaxID=1419009 RepID=A0AAV5A0S0_9AGAM|nr:hypothetical protein Clacol_001267 [Clathrus columnatus]
MSPGDVGLWVRTTFLKQRNSALRVYLSIGGWSFNDPPTSTIFSQLVASSEHTQAFINSALTILQTYGFDGIDIDWEYPGAYDRGGGPADTANYVTFMSKVKSAFQPYGYGLTFTAPSSYWYLQHFDLPGLLKSADWVNVLTYDLHGVWDGTDPSIGPIVLAHTNLTEIMQTMQLFRNVAINPAQIAMGIGFYGRSFQLADPSCSDPGCVFSGPADAGPCSGNPGTLMFSEIESIINDNDLEPTFDEAAAVKYIVWNGNQWVSYDDAQTLQMKLNYANSICLSGTLIWSLDQDDTSYTALSGLYGFIPNNTASQVVTGDECMITDCGSKGCPSGYTPMTQLASNPATGTTCSKKDLATLCCPSGDAPQQCHWRGGGGHTCNPQCDVGEITIATDLVGDDGKPTCVQGFKAYCCQSGEPALDCDVGECGDTTCPDPNFVIFTHVKQGNQGSAGCEEPDQFTQFTVPTCPTIPITAQNQSIYPQVQLGESFLPVPEDWVFPQVSPVGGDYLVDQPATFTVDFDDEGVDDENENDTPVGFVTFGEVFISSPNPGAVSSVSPESDWVVTGCLRSSDQGQSVIKVLAYCSKSMDDEESGCGHVFIGQAEHTIVKMPKTCGLGPYARVVSLDVHPNQTVLSGTYHQANIPPNEKVYALTFDYNFAAIPESNGPVLMRADLRATGSLRSFSYQAKADRSRRDQIIDSAPDEGTVSTKRKRDFHQPEGLQRRWFGPFDSWLKKMTTLSTGDTSTRSFFCSFNYPIFQQSESCPHFTSSLDISVSGSAQAVSDFGYYLEASVVPPAIQEAYVFVRASASAQATFSITGMAAVTFDSEKTELISFGFPGLYYPGLLTLGPSLVLYGQAIGQISMSGQLTTTVGYQFPSLDLSFGKMDSNSDEDNFGPPINPNGNNEGYNFNFAYNVDLDGKAEVPTFQLGVSVLGGQLLDAQIFVEADMYGGVSINGSVSKAYYGANLNAGLTGSVLWWQDNAISTPFYSNEFPFGGTCFQSMVETPIEGSGSNSKRDIGIIDTASQQEFLISDSAYQGEPLDFKEEAYGSSHAAYHINSSILGDNDVEGEVTPGIVKRSSVPFLPGSLFCPEAGDEITSSLNGTDCACYDDDAANDPIFGSGALSRRTLSEFDNSTDPLHILANTASKLRSCPGKSIPIPAWDTTPIIAYYDLQNPTTLDPTYGQWIPMVPVNLGTNKKGQPFMTIQGGEVVYGREHPYEVSMAGLFVDFLQLQEDIWQNAAGNQAWCTWVQNNLQNTPNYVQPLFGGNSMFQQISSCYPSNTAQTPMVVLEQMANVIKNNAFYSTEIVTNRIDQNPPSIRNPTKFATYCPKKMVAVLRSAVGVTSFLNAPPVQQIFLQMNTCIRDAWVAWYDAYLTANVDAPNRDDEDVNVPELYDDWVHGIIQNTPTFIRNQVQALISLYNPNDPSSSGTQDVDLSWAVLLDEKTDNALGDPILSPTTQYAVGVPVSRDDLTNQVLSAVQNIAWLNQLPTH